MTSVFLTGFPGFLGSQLSERLLARYGDDVRINCLVQRRYRGLAERRVAELVAQHPAWAGRMHLINGDIAEPDLRLGSAYDELARDTLEIFHLAAVYDLGVKRDLAMRVNVDGTRNMLSFAEKCGGGLRRFQYVSTCYVSGRYKGNFSEHDLVRGQTFNNYYEETKYLAEVDVQGQMSRGLPVTIYRPSVVVGDSTTGATQKYDGPYYFIQWMLRYPKFTLMPVIGDAEWCEFNMAPRDFVVNAIDYLSSREDSEGKVYQLCDPRPLTIDLMASLLGRIVGARLVRLPMPLGFAKWSFGLPPMRAWTKVEPASLDYFVHPTHYTCDHTLRDLAGSGIACPPVTAYARTMVQFMREHPEIPASAMV